MTDGPQILIPSVPKHLKITQTMIEDAMTDDVTRLAEFTFKIKMDEFQKSRFKISWWVPRVMDSSGYNSAKTVNLFWVSVLRCIVIPDHVAAIYFQSFPTMQQAFYPYFSRYAAQSDFFRAQVGKPRVVGLDGVEEDVSKGASKNPSCYAVDFLNQSKILMPAGSFLQDSKNQAGLRFNFLGIDEWPKIDATGSTGIDDQLIGRTNRENFNKEHPFWTNHQMFLGTAEDAVHPGYDRWLYFKRRVAAGDPNFAILQYSYKDWSHFQYRDGKSFREKLRDDDNIADMRRKGRAKVREELLGIWSDNGRGLYTPELIKAAYNLGKERNVLPITGHRSPTNLIGARPTFYFCGIDPAKSDSRKSDDGAVVVLRARQVGESILDLRDMELDFIWAYQVRGADGEQWAAILQRKHLHFGFSRIVMDPNGGGQWIRPELAKARREVPGENVRVRPIACIEDEEKLPMNSEFILSMFSWQDTRISELWSECPRRHDDNLYDLAHSEFHEAISNRLIGLPERLNDRPQQQTAEWTEERKHANRLLQKMAIQLTRVFVKTNENGTTFTSAHGARLYSARGNKDFAYAGMYAYVAFREWLKEQMSEGGNDVPEESAAMCG